jgi:hypothetical protein
VDAVLFESAVKFFEMGVEALDLGKKFPSKEY